KQVVPSASDLVDIDHLGIELVEIRTLGGGDRIGVRRIAVEHRIYGGDGDDLITVGTNAGVGFTATTWPNTGGILDDIDAALIVGLGAGDDTLRISSTIDGIAGNLAGILSAIAIEAGGGTNDRLYVDDFTTSGDRIGVMGYDPGDLTHAAHDFIAGLGMSIGN